MPVGSASKADSETFVSHHGVPIHMRDRRCRNYAMATSRLMVHSGVPATTEAADSVAFVRDGAQAGTQSPVPFEPAVAVPQPLLPTSTATESRHLRPMPIPLLLMRPAPSLLKALLLLSSPPVVPPPQIAVAPTPRVAVAQGERPCQRCFHDRMDPRQRHHSPTSVPPL